MTVLEQQPNFPWGTPVNITRIKRRNNQRIEDFVEEGASGGLDSGIDSVNTRLPLARSNRSTSSSSSNSYVATPLHDNDEISSPLGDIQSTAPPLAYAKVVSSPVNPTYNSNRG